MKKQLQSETPRNQATRHLLTPILFLESAHSRFKQRGIHRFKNKSIKSSSRFSQIYLVVMSIPKGKVMTYGQVAKKAGVTPRVVGFAMHRNPDPKRIWCHRVVNREGRLAKNYAFGGIGEQKRRLVAEGVSVNGNFVSDLATVLVK